MAEPTVIVPEQPIWRSQTFTALLLYVVTLACNAVARRWGIELNATEIAAFTATVIGFIAGRQYKQGKLLDNGAHPLQNPVAAPAEEPKPAAPVVPPAAGPVAAALLCICALSLSACETPAGRALGNYFKAVGECSLSSATNEGAALIKELDGATKKGVDIDWQAKGTALGFDVLKCALEALAGMVQNRLEVAVSKNEMGALPDREVAALRDQITRVRVGLASIEKAAASK